MGHSSPRTGKLSTRGIFLMAKAPSLRKARNKGTQRTRKLSAGNALRSWRNGKGRFVRARRRTAGAKPYTMKVVRTVFNGGHEETYGNATRLVPTQLVDKVVRIALQRAIAAGRVGIETTARFDGDIGCFLHRLDRKVPCRLDDDSSLAADPGDDRGSVFVVMASTGLAFLAAPPGLATQYLLPAVCRLALVARSMVEIIRFDRAVQLALYLIGQGGIPEPPTPPIAGADMHP